MTLLLALAVGGMCFLLGAEPKSSGGIRNDRTVGLLSESLVPQMQTVNRGLTIKQYQPTIQPISVTPATTIQPIATVVTGSNVKDDYERTSSHLSEREHFQHSPPPCVPSHHLGP